jgi:hypothetical protein
MVYLPRRVLTGAAFSLIAWPAFAAAIIDNGVVMLGVNDLANLNVPGGVPSPVEGSTDVGLRHLVTGNESTAHACSCEGWGVGIGETGVSGYANNAAGTANLTLVSFASTASTARSEVNLASGELNVVHMFAPAAETPNLYRVAVDITNTSGVAITDLRYTRTFDWDVEPTAFSEFVTHIGVATTPSVLLAIDNGFVSSDPFDAGRSVIVAGGTGDFTDLGPADHGSNFDFGFGALAAGATFSFEIFYGAASTQTAALVALGLVGAEVASLGQSENTPRGETFIFAFGDVGGVVVPPEVPLPAAGLLMFTAIGLLGGAAARRRKA